MKCTLKLNCTSLQFPLTTLRDAEFYVLLLNRDVLTKIMTLYFNNIIFSVFNLISDAEN